MYDITVGHGQQYATSIKIFHQVASLDISQDKVSYSIPDAIFGLSMKVYKDTDEGESLQFLIEKGSSAKAVKARIESIALKYATPSQLKRAFKLAVSKARFEGAAEKAQEIRKALGVTGYGSL